MKMNKFSSFSQNNNHQVKIDVRKEKEFPSLISFPHGVPENVDNEEVKIVANRKRTEKFVKTNLEITLDKLTYKGYDYGEHSYKKNCYNYAVGVVSSSDPSKMKIYPCTQAFIMRPEIAEKAQQVKVKEEELSAAEKSAAAATEYLEKRESLTNEFGSKKKKRAMNAAKSNIISSDNISGASHLQNMFTTKSSDVDHSELIKAAEDVVNKMKRKKRSSY
jgi:hypothetical protein